MFFPHNKKHGQSEWILSKISLLLYVMVIMVFLTSFWNISSKKVNERMATSIAQDIASKIDFVINSSGKNTFMYIPLPKSPNGIDKEQIPYTVQITSRFVHVELEKQNGYSLIIPNRYNPQTTDTHFIEIGKENKTNAINITSKEINNGIVLLVNKTNQTINITVGT